MKFRVKYKEVVTYPVEVEAEDFESAKKKADAIVFGGFIPYETSGIEFDDIRLVKNGDKPILDGILDHEMVKAFLMASEETTDAETVDLWNDLFSDDEDKLIAKSLDDLLSANFMTMVEFVKYAKDKRISLDDIHTADDYFWFDNKTGEICSGTVREAVDSKIDFDVMTDTLIASDYYGEEELMKRIKAYNKKKLKASKKKNKRTA